MPVVFVSLRGVCVWFTPALKGQGILRQLDGYFLGLLEGHGAGRLGQGQLPGAIGGYGQVNHGSCCTG